MSETGSPLRAGIGSGIIGAGLGGGLGFVGTGDGSLKQRLATGALGALLGGSVMGTSAYRDQEAENERVRARKALEALMLSQRGL